MGMKLRGVGRIPSVLQLIDLALDEDLGRGDVTTDSTVDAETRANAVLVARQDLVVFGLEVAAAVFARVDPAIEFEALVDDGAEVEAGTHAARVSGPAGSILKAERTALNFMQRLSGVATMARTYAAAVEGTNTRVVDTRKTTPGYRVLQKAAVLAGGCHNHRFDLGSGVLIKDNHIAACGSVTAAVERARERAPHPYRVEVEVETFEELDQALAARADIVLLDNMSPEQVREAAAKCHAANVMVEVSGGITLETIRAYAEAGADVISSGALTHSAGSVDLALDFE
jgi:nicotinate-nucleotide pyrophosphorylase (carboxylating)